MKRLTKYALFAEVIVKATGKRGTVTMATQDRRMPEVAYCVMINGKDDWYDESELKPARRKLAK
jgi:hypothetical protein